MTRVLLPTFIAICVLLLAIWLLPIAKRELMYRLFGGEDAYENSVWLEDLPERNWER